MRFAAIHLEVASLATLRGVQAQIAIHGWFDSWCLGWAWFDWTGGPVWGWDSVISGERAVLRILPDQRAAVAVMTNSSTGRALCRSLLADLMNSLFGIRVPSLRLGVSPGAAGDLSRFAGVYAWPDRQVQVTAAGSGLVPKEEHEETEVLPIDERTFLVDPSDPDNPTVTFAGSDAARRPQVLYLMLSGASAPEQDTSRTRKPAELSVAPHFSRIFVLRRLIKAVGLLPRSPRLGDQLPVDGSRLRA